MRQQWNDKRLKYKDRLHGGMAGKRKIQLKDYISISKNNQNHEWLYIFQHLMSFIEIGCIFKKHGFPHLQSRKILPGHQ